MNFDTQPTTTLAPPPIASNQSFVLELMRKQDEISNLKQQISDLKSDLKVKEIENKYQIEILSSSHNHSKELGDIQTASSFTTILKDILPHAKEVLPAIVNGIQEIRGVKTYRTEVKQYADFLEQLDGNRLNVLGEVLTAIVGKGSAEEFMNNVQKCLSIINHPPANV